MDQLFKNLKPITRYNRLSYLDKIGLTIENHNKFLSDEERVINLINEGTKSPATISTRLFHILMFLEELVKLYNKESDKNLLNIYNKYKDQYSKNTFNYVKDTSESKPIIPLEKLQLTWYKHWPLTKKNGNIYRIKNITKIPLFNKETITWLIDFIILGLYVINPPLRNDLASLKLIKSPKQIVDKESNYIVVGPSSTYILMNDFKNVRSMGSDIKISLHPDIILLIKELIKSYNKIGYEEPEYLFNALGKNTLRPYTDGGMIQKLKKLSKEYFNEQLSVNDYRRIWETSIQNSSKYKMMTLREKEKIHNSMLHSIGAAQFYNKVFRNPSIQQE